MKVTSPVDIDTVVAAEDAITVLSPAKISIHNLKAACADVRVMRVATTLVEAGFEVTIVDIATRRSLPNEEYIRGIYFKHVIVPSWYSSRRFEPWFFVTAVQTLVLSTLRLVQTQADVYHASELTALPACCIAALLRHKPLVFDIRDLHFPVPETCIGFWRRLGGLLTRVYAAVLPRCAGVIATSPLHAQAIRNRFHLAEISLLRNFPPYRVVQRSDRLRQFLDLGSNVRIALFQGNIQPNRQLDRLVRAAPFLERDIVIVMMGKDIGSTQARLEALIVNEGVADRVKILPPVPYEELLDWTASADIGLIVYPLNYSLNLQLHLPQKLFEYLMAGLPVLSSSLDAVVEVIKTYDVGQVVSSLTPADIAATINTMLADHEALTRMRCNALCAAKELCWEKEHHKLIRFYHDILAWKHVKKSKGKV